MKRIAPETDRLMWLVAESRDLKAISDFEERFPELSDELATRIAAVSSLKFGQRPRVSEVPRFAPRMVAPRTQNRLIYIAFAAVLASVAFGSYTATVLLNRSEPAKPQGPGLMSSATGSPPARETNSFQRLDERQENNPAPLAVDPPHTPETVPDNPLMHRVTLSVEDAQLVEAIQMICRSANLNAEFAPNMPDMIVAFEYTDTPAEAVLEDLGSKYGFTAIPQERGKVLIIPARPNPADTKQENENRSGRG